MLRDFLWMNRIPAARWPSSRFSAFFALGWLAMFLFLFLERGAPQP